MTESLSRDRTLDCIRGWAIVWMTSTHVAPDSKLTAVLHLPLYLSAFEWFAMLSGCVLGMRAWRARQRLETPRLLASVRRQTWLLYRLHVVLVIAVLVIHETTGQLNAPSVQELGGFGTTLLLVVTLGLQPPDFMNIMPLYVVLFAIAPLLVWLLIHGHTALLVALSTALWLVGQFQPDLLPFPFRATEPRHFSLLSWQFIFMLGLTAGFHRNGTLGEFWARHGRRLLAMAFAVALALFLLAQLQRRVAHGLGLQLPEHLLWLLDKKSFGPARAVYAITALAVTAWCVGKLLTWSVQSGSRLRGLLRRALSSLELVGRHCLACFVLHLALALTAAALEVDERAQILSEFTLLAAMTLLFAGCLGWDRLLRAGLSGRLPGAIPWSARQA